MKTRLQSLLANDQFDEAASLLKSSLKDAQLIDPRDEHTWRDYADQIAASMQERGDRSTVIAFWEDLLGFFINDLQPAWEHIHKGRIFFRLGWLALPDSVAKGKKYLEEALEEARKFWRKEAAEGRIAIEDIEKAVAESSSYVTLCIVERIEDEEFDSDAEKQRFFEELLSPSFDAAIFGDEVKANAVMDAIDKIFATQAITEQKMVEIRKQAEKMKKQLDQVASKQVPVAVVSLAGAVLESILLGVLYARGVAEIEVKGKCKKVERKDILKVTLGPLVKEASSRSVFPSGSVKTSCRLIQIFRNRLHVGNEIRSKYGLTPRVARTLKILLDWSIVDWGRAIS